MASDDHEITSTFHSFDRDVPSVLYEPEGESDRDHVAFVFMHPDSDFLSHPGTQALAARGYRTMGVNNRSARKGSYHLHELLPDLGMAVGRLRDHPDIETVVLVGHSGGAHLSSFYQNVAENGWEVARDDDKLLPAPADLPGLQSVDGVVLLDGHTGYGPKGLLDLGGHLADESGIGRVGSLDMYARENGFVPDGRSSYDQAFLDRWFRAQADRMERLVAHCQSRLDALDAGYGDLDDDEPFVLVDIKSRAYKTDPSLLAHTREAWPVVYADEPPTRQEEIVRSVRDARQTDGEPPLTYAGPEVMPMTVRKYLSTHAVRVSGEYRVTEDSIEGIDHGSTNASTIGNLRGVTVPLLVLPATGHYFVVQGETYHDNAAASDKTLVYINGADHGFEPLADRYGDTFNAAYDEIDAWAEGRYV